MYKIKICLFIIILSLGLTACSDSDKGSLNLSTLNLEVSNDTVFLDSSNPDDVALTFKWDSGASKGNDYYLVYYFRLTTIGSDFNENSTDPIIIEEEDDKIVSYSHQELSDLLIAKWGVKPGDNVALQSRLVAKVIGPKFQYPEISYINVVIYNYPENPLFIMGSATSAENDPTKAIPVEEKEAGELYQWVGNLKPGGFKFIKEHGVSLPSLNKGLEDNTFTIRESESDPDDLFTVDKEGLYSVTIGMKNKKIVYGPMLYSNLYLVGSATSAEWTIKDAIELSPTPFIPNELHATVVLKEGELKFYSAKDFNSMFFKPLKANASITEDLDFVYEVNGEDRKWKVQKEEEGLYKISLNLNTNKVKFERIGNN